MEENPELLRLLTIERLGTPDREEGDPDGERY
jgi:hypothetical protein